MQGISWAAVNLLAYQQGLCSMWLVVTELWQQILQNQHLFRNVANFVCDITVFCWKNRARYLFTHANVDHFTASWKQLYNSSSSVCKRMSLTPNGVFFGRPAEFLPSSGYETQLPNWHSVSLRTHLHQTHVTQYKADTSHSKLFTQHADNNINKMNSSWRNPTRRM
jgi:hypothetical protein